MTGYGLIKGRMAMDFWIINIKVCPVKLLNVIYRTLNFNLLNVCSIFFKIILFLGNV